MGPLLFALSKIVRLNTTRKYETENTIVLEAHIFQYCWSMLMLHAPGFMLMLMCAYALFGSICTCAIDIVTLKTKVFCSS